MLKKINSFRQSCKANSNPITVDVVLNFGFRQSHCALSRCKVNMVDSFISLEICFISFINIFLQSTSPRWDDVVSRHTPGVTSTQRDTLISIGDCNCLQSMAAGKESTSNFAESHLLISRWVRFSVQCHQLVIWNNRDRAV